MTTKNNPKQLKFIKIIKEVEDSLKAFEDGKFTSAKKVFSNLRKKSPKNKK